MNFKRVSTAAMALAMTASLGSAALAADLPQGWTPADGARGPMLISTNPNAGSYDKTITINDEVLEGYEYEREVPGWGSETISVKLAEIPGAPAGYLPLRAVLQADGASAYWDADSYTSSFYYEKDMIVADFHSMSVSVNDEKVEGAKALLAKGVSVVVVTMGPKGCAVFTKGYSFRKNTYDTQVKDTTGSGDSFFGALLAKIVQSGKKPGELAQEELEGFVDFANAAGAVCATKTGAIPALPDTAAIEACRKTVPLLKL